MPKISFIIATRNRANVIRDTLDSLLTQNNKDWEAIIVDDHGNDNTEEVVSKYNDLRFKYFPLPDDNGIGICSARNFAAMQASSDILAILDSDDIATPDRVDITLDAFKKDPNGDVFYAHLDILDEETGTIKERKSSFVPFNLEKLRKENFIPHSTVAFKRKVLLDHPYNTFFHLSEDYELYTRLACLGKRFIYDSRKVLRYRMGKNNISHGSQKAILLKNYSDIAHMYRGWMDYDQKVVLETIKLEREQRDVKN